jgi:hypothetical protein
MTNHNDFIDTCLAELARQVGAEGITNPHSVKTLALSQIQALPDIRSYQIMVWPGFARHTVTRDSGTWVVETPFVAQTLLELHKLLFGETI